MTERRKREVILASSAGFCFGVKKAVETVYREAEESKDTVYSYGAIIHNEEVVRDLTEKGVVVFEDADAAAKVGALPEQAGPRSTASARRRNSALSIRPVPLSIKYIKSSRRKTERDAGC